MADEQTGGREMNGATPGGKPDATTSDEAVKRTGLKARTAGGPDGPDATVVGDTFKKGSGKKGAGEAPGEA
jgi:ribonucleotide monophosphatase NagD (HAD superfamily)